jgi:RHS repeat-associated protein
MNRLLYGVIYGVRSGIRFGGSLSMGSDPVFGSVGHYRSLEPVTGSDPEDDNPYADFTSSGSLNMRYVDGLVVDELFARTDSSGNTAWYLRDNIGSFYADVTTTMVLDAAVYDPFGNIVTETNASEGDRFKFAGMEYDPVNVLYYDHARYYDAGIGRFVSQDPKGFNAGDTNLYRYVGNEPTSSRDTSGLGDEPAMGQRKPPASFPLPPDPTGLPSGWLLDPSHRDPNGTRHRDPNGNWLDWHPGNPLKPPDIWGGRDHWHYNGGKRHLPPGTPVPPLLPPVSPPKPSNKLPWPFGPDTSWMLMS